MEFNEIEKLMQDFEKSKIRELEITNNGFHIHLSKNKTPFLKSDEIGEEKKVATLEEVVEPKEKNEFIRSTLVGSVYLQPKPDQKPYVTVGSRVHKGDIVCIIEAMKMMTEIKSDKDGIISEILVENEDLVEFDEPLFKVRQALD